MLKVSVDMKRGVYVVRGDNQEQLVQVPMRGHLDKESVKSTRKEIGSKKWIPSEKLNLVDVGVYNALREYDRKYETDYANRYVNVTSKQIPYSSTAEKKRHYEKRATEIKSQEFLNNGIAVEYNLSLFSGLKNMNIRERFQAIRVALSQKRNGVKVQFANNKQLLLEAPAESVIPKEDEIQSTEITQDVIQQQAPQIPTPIQERNAPSFEEMMNIFKEIPEKKESPVGFMSVPKISVEPNVIPTETEPKTARVSTKINVPEIQISPVVPAIPGENAVEETLEDFSNSSSKKVLQDTHDRDNKNTKSEENIAPQLAKKTISRSKAIGATKKAYRDSKKKIYQQQLQEKAKQRAKAKEMASKGQTPTFPPKQKTIKQTPPVLPPKQKQIKPEPPALPPKPEPENLKLEALASLRKIVPSKAVALASLKGIASLKGELQQQAQINVARFTGNIKEKAKLISNKKLTPRQRKIAGAVTLVTSVALVAAISAGVARYAVDTLQNNNTYNQTNVPQIEQVVTLGQEVNEGKDGIHEGISREDYKQQRITARGEERAEDSTAVQEAETKGQEDIKQQQDTRQEDIKQEQQNDKIQYLSSIKVGSALDINGGKYFETPEGTGNYGKFENYTDGVKRISMIEIMTRDGYKIVKDSDTNLYQLKQQYPDAKFSYHMVFEKADGTKTTLGWLTEDSLEQNRGTNQIVNNDIDDIDM